MYPVPTFKKDNIFYKNDYIKVLTNLLPSILQEYLGVVVCSVSPIAVVNAFVCIFLSIKKTNM